MCLYGFTILIAMASNGQFPIVLGCNSMYVHLHHLQPVRFIIYKSALYQILGTVLYSSYTAVPVAQRTNITHHQSHNSHPPPAHQSQQRGVMDLHQK